MEELLIAIIGDVNPSRTYDPPMTQPAKAAEAAERLGVALAEAGYRILACDARYVEASAVKGYASSSKAEPASIVVEYPLDDPQAAEFPEVLSKPKLFNFRPDSSKQWEMSFYKSLRSVDGVVLIGGGGPSTLISGVLARSYGVPLLALGAYGGSARTVWDSLVPGQDLVDDEGKQCMGVSWAAGVEQKWIAALSRQFTKRAAEIEGRRARVQQWWAIAMIIGVGLLIALGASLTPDNTAATLPVTSWFKMLFWLAPIAAGMAGGAVRVLLAAGATPTLGSIAKGAGAGFVAALLYLLAQQFSNPSAYSFPVYLCAMVFALIGGFTYETVFKKLESTDVTRTEALPGGG